MPEPQDDPRATFTYLSNEYAQALQAFSAIEGQAATLVALGGSDDLRIFIEQFVEMAERTRQLALDRGELNFAEWFAELIEKAEAVRGAILQQ